MPQFNGKQDASLIFAIGTANLRCPRNGEMDGALSLTTRSTRANQMPLTP
jgi:hypothetical protein